MIRSSVDDEYGWSKQVHLINWDLNEQIDTSDSLGSNGCGASKERRSWSLNSESYCISREKLFVTSRWIRMHLIRDAGDRIAVSIENTKNEDYLPAYGMRLTRLATEWQSRSHIDGDTCSMPVITSMVITVFVRTETRAWQKTTMVKR